jgi:polyisoprenoid-binding protein YceI
MNRYVTGIIAAFTGTFCLAAPVTYVLDPGHTYPSFAADHMGGLSVWRGKFKTTSGTVVLDKEAKTGTIDVTVETNSVDFGMEKLNEHVRSPDIFDVAKYPTATFKGHFTKWNDAGPTEAEGSFTFHGVTRPLTLKIDSFLCKPSPMTKKEVCGADASAAFNRSDFGVHFGDDFGFKQGVTLQIQVEGSPGGAAH